MSVPLSLRVLHRLDPETAHGVALRALRLGLVQHAPPPPPALATTALGLRLASPLGLAAGFDKDGRAIAPLARLGFGFLEIGTVTPRPQRGNPRPRLFRLDADRAAINRFGFNNAGIAALRGRLAAPRTVPIGVNLGINKDAADPERDYPALLALVAKLADYVVVNVSSPNTPGLRDLQAESRLGAILAAMTAAVPAHPPLLVKLAPDLADTTLRGVIETCRAAGVAGLILTNTTTERPATLRDKQAGQPGGLSGAPLFRRATALLARARLMAGDSLTLIGTGGIASGADALCKLQAGATLVQLYTALVFAGPGLVARINAELAAALTAAGFAGPAAATGTDAERIAGWN